ncbi:MAG: isoleucine--tRNA ligase [Candidatus Schekmanbacteria bacterium]|nr:isoleucine--tRNA ligase [Candidatus Schekmanbacteria bacterium]
MGAFPPVPENPSFPDLERQILSLWEKTDAFRRSVDQRAADDAYVFYDGPPFATGLPHYGHLVASTIKDIVPRYWAMRGKRVERRFGWDTHGLPIEMEMEKALGLTGPASIRQYGVDKFNEACRANVLRYTEQWRETITRLGRWVDFDDDYKTMDLEFMESVWWVLSQLWQRGLVYRTFRVMPYSWRLSTPLSNFEANLDYRDVQDPAITVRVPLDGDPDGASLLIWTTTPWTLPSNLAIAVGPDIDYVRARWATDGRVYVLARARLEATLDNDAEILAELKGSELLGLGYAPLFPFFAEKKTHPRGKGGAFFVIPSASVTTDEGTGLVHMAPAYGEEDFYACAAAGIEPVDPVDEEGRFLPAVHSYAGQHVKDADKNIIRDLKEQGSLIRQTTIQHSYPYCWRSGTPLIYKTVPTWAVRVEQLRYRMVELNERIHWVPDAVGQKRFGNWLAEARDWTISRSRFWGTPIPIWECESCKALDCVGSVAALEQKTASRITDIHPHFIDCLTYTCAACGGQMRRIPDVFDCWFESGAMPYAQIHYPFANKERFERQFPAQFIAEGLDQTRGWFYTLLVLSTGIFNEPPFFNVIVNGMVLAEDGSKMSKSKRNFPPPDRILDEYGADALRAYLIDSPVVRAEPLRFSERGVREVVRTVLLPIYHAWSFFVQYANVDGWDPSRHLADTPALGQRPELDRWILSVLQSLVRNVNSEMQGYYLYKVVPPMVSFIDDLTNWYIRRSRRRFWRNADDAANWQDKLCAYGTLYEVLVSFTKVLAPVLPFITETVYQSLVVAPGAHDSARESVHLCDYPEVEDAKIDRDLEAQVAITRQVVSRGRALREQHRLRTRQPLASCTVVTHDELEQRALRAHAELICEELNVKDVVVVDDDASLCRLSFAANFRTLGKRLGKRMKEAAATISAWGGAQWQELQAGQTVEVCGERIGLDDVIVTRAARGDVVVQTEGTLTVAFDTHLTDELRAEGLMRETVSRLQRLRKDSGLQVTDRIELRLATGAADLRQALEQFSEHIAEEVLATSLEISAQTSEAGAEVMDVDERVLQVVLRRAVAGH